MNPWTPPINPANLPPDEDPDDIFLSFVTDGPKVLGIGDGVSRAFPLSDDGEEFVTGNVFSVWRSDYQGTHLLATTPRTNYIIQSQAYKPQYAPWSIVGSVVTDAAAVAPDGTLTASSVSQSAAGGYVQQPVGNSGTQTWTGSVFVKPGTATSLTIGLHWWQVSSEMYVTMTFNPQTGALIGTSSANGASFVSYTILPLSNGWTRISVSGVGSMPNYDNLQLRLGNNTPGSSLFYTWGYQLELGRAPTSYIPTATTPVSVGPDATFDAESGVLYFQNPPLRGSTLLWEGNYIYEQSEQATWEKTVLSQYANSPTLMKLVETFEDQIDPEVNISTFIDSVWNILTAHGYGLDVWGRIVGVTRVLNVPTISVKYLGYKEAGGGFIEPFNTSPFYQQNPASANYVMSDDLFRTVIFTKALMNVSRATIQTYNRALIMLFPGFLCQCVETGPMAVTLQFSTVLTPVQKAILQQSGVFSPPTGVRFTISP